MNNAIVRQESDLAVLPIIDLQTAINRRDAIVQFVKSIMVEGIDFGKIPGTNDKNVLFKPGAEKLTTFFGLSKQFDIIERVETWEGNEPFFYYLYRAKLYRGEILIAEGDGSCNSHESKYRWRWVTADELPPNLHPDDLMTRKTSISEYEFAINKRETSGQYGKPAEYWDQFEAAIKAGEAKSITRKTGSGKELPAWEIESVAYRVPNPDVASVVNTIQKMAQKRALIAATLLAVNASEFFTQDLEDFDDFGVIEGQYTEPEPEPEAKPEPQTRNRPASRPAKASKPTNGGGKVADNPQSQFWYYVSTHEIDRAAAADILTECDGDFGRALDVLRGATDVVPPNDQPQQDKLAEWETEEKAATGAYDD